MKRLKCKSSSMIKELVFILVLILVLVTAACDNIGTKVEASDLTAGITANTVSGKAIDGQFINNTAEFSINLFKKTLSESDNSLISPLSVILALAMTANGADSETLSQMEEVLGKDIPLSDLNEYLYYYVRNLPSEDKMKLAIANSIWFRDDEERLKVEKDFLQTNADYYHASIYKAPFDQTTLDDINNWVNINTDGMIDQIIDQIDADTVMYLINAVVFDAEWQNVYNKENIYEDEFTAVDGEKHNVEFMRSEESSYLDDGNATGFVKPYYDGKYSFVTLLPNQGVSIDDYIESLSGESFIALLDNTENTPVNASLPKFSYDYEIKMNDALKALGMPEGFSPDDADFSKMGHSSIGNIYIGKVLHKTYITVDELGTKAGAVTKVEMNDEAYMETKNVVLDRPFVYAIIDNETDLPIFIGVVKNLE